MKKRAIKIKKALKLNKNKKEQDFKLQDFINTVQASTLESDMSLVRSIRV